MNWPCERVLSAWIFGKMPSVSRHRFSHRNQPKKSMHFLVSLLRMLVSENDKNWINASRQEGGL